MARRVLVAATLVMLVAALAPANVQAGERSSYIVVFKDSVRDPGAVAHEQSRANGAQVTHVYRHALKGYSASMSDVAAAKVANDRRVHYVEPDGVVHKTSHPSPVWGLDRIDEEYRPMDGAYVHNYDGTGVHAYVIDSGITQHGDFAGRLETGTDIVEPGTSADDCDGHGTHVAGTIGGTTYGVAKNVRLVPVRVLNCSGSGSWSGVIAGVDWVTANAIKPAVANMSLGGGANDAVDKAVTNSVKAGITYAVAAGNGNSGGKAQDACGYSPARTPAALTVGATNSTDTKASWSNYGTCLDLFAPGVGIKSTTMDGLTATWSGTSMAAPHVAGVAALYLHATPSATTADVASAITTQATVGIVENEGLGSPDKLLFSLLTAVTGGTDGGTETDPPPAGDTTIMMSDSISQKMNSGKGGKSELLVEVKVTSQADSTPISGAGVSVSITDGSSTWSGTGTTNSNGIVTFKLGNIRSGCYTSSVTNVTPPSSGYEWDKVGASTEPLCKT